MGTPEALLSRLQQLWQRETTRPTRLLIATLLGASLVGVALLARVGTTVARLSAAAWLLGALLAATGAVVVARRRRGDRRRLLAGTVARTEPRLGAAALRALNLTERTAAQPAQGSPQLARLHLLRLLSRASGPLLASQVARVSWRRSLAALGLAALCFAVVIFDPLRPLEGLAVFAARGGRAPVALEWMAEGRVVASPPAYLQQRPHRVEPRVPTSVHTGTVVTITGEPRHAGRPLVLTDGLRETPFVDDGQGVLVARWTVAEPTRLTIAARFGDVLVLEPTSLELQTTADLPPYVRLEGAPKTIQLLDQPRVPIHYEAVDDHGLNEVSMVLRAGAREQRRKLSEPRGGSRADRGGVVLRMDDEFLKRSYLPVEVTVEARDNDGFIGPKTGRSPSIVIVPPRIAEREARRLAAFRAVRDSLTDLLAARLRQGAPPAAERAHVIESDERRQQIAFDQVERLLSERFGGIRFGGAVRALAHGQLERLERSRERYAAQPVAGNRTKLLQATESAVLAVDVALAALGDRDTRVAARKLAEVATEAATAIELSRQLDERERADRRLDAALQVLAGGGDQLLLLGALGEDLGEIVHNGLRRIRRAWKQGDRYHARLAAEDLAARLRVPDHSFGSAGGGGVEAGGPPRIGQDGVSDAASEAAGLEQALEQLRREHAAELGSVERALERAQSEVEQQRLAEELREHAEAVRRAVSELPRSGPPSGSPRATAAAGRAHAEAMAGALERGKLADAVRRGKRALETLQQADQLGRDAPPGSADADASQAAREASERLAAELRWAEQALQQMQDDAAERAGAQLERSAGREAELAERARRLRRESAEGEAPLPQSMLDRLDQAADAMQQAERLLRGLKGTEGLQAQRQAQRLLEMAMPENEDIGPDQDGEEGDGHEMAKDSDVPGEYRDPRARAFRQRVTDGLRGKVPPHLRDALRRYAEGLLR